MPDPPRYLCSASARPRIAPGELPDAIGVESDPPGPRPIGIAFGDEPIGSEEEGTLEQAWRLVVGGVEIEGRYALRGGAFVELAEEA